MTTNDLARHCCLRRRSWGLEGHGWWVKDRCSRDRVKVTWTKNPWVNVTLGEESGVGVHYERKKDTSDKVKGPPHWGETKRRRTRSPYLRIQFSIFRNLGDLVLRCSVLLAIIAKSVTLITLVSHFFETSVTY